MRTYAGTKFSWNSFLIVLSISVPAVVQAAEDALHYTAFELGAEQILRDTRQADLVRTRLDQLENEFQPLSEPEAAYAWFIRCLQGEELPSSDDSGQNTAASVNSVDRNAADYLCKGISSQSDQARFINQYQSYNLQSQLTSAALRYRIAYYYAELGLRMGLEADGVRATGVMLEIAEANDSDYLRQGAYQMRAILQAELREFDDALESNQRAIDLSATAREWVGLMQNRGYILSYAERFDEAVALYQQLIDGSGQGAGISDADRIHIGTNLSFIYAETGQTQKNLELTRNMTNLAQVLNQEDLSAWANMSRAFALLDSGDIEQGRALFEQYSGWFVDNNYAVRTAEDYEQLSEILYAHGYHEDAYQALRRSVDLLREVDAGDGDIKEELVNAILAAEQSQRQLMQTRQSMELLQQRRQAQINLLLAILGGLTLVLSVGLYSYRRLKKLNRDLDQANEKLDYESNHDPMTGACNRRYFYQYLAEQANSDAAKGAVLLALIDVDHFKLLNDNHGHDVGDEVLKLVVKRLQNTLKSGDKLVRWGGEEFLLYLPVPDTVGQYQSLVDRLLGEINNTAFNINGANLAVTISMGFRVINAKENIDREVKRVDELLYQAKRMGRSRAVGGD